MGAIALLLACMYQPFGGVGYTGPVVHPPAAFRVLSNRLVTVIGPTPPGTGVIHAHFGATASKSTSPPSRYPRFRVGSAMRWIPTSTTTAPGFTMSAVMKPALPM